MKEEPKKEEPKPAEPVVEEKTPLEKEVEELTKPSAHKPPVIPKEDANDPKEASPFKEKYKPPPGEKAPDEVKKHAEENKVIKAKNIEKAEKAEEAREEAETKEVEKIAAKKEEAHQKDIQKAASVMPGGKAAASAPPAA